MAQLEKLVVTNTNRELLLEKYIKTSRKVDIIHVIQLWRDGVFSTSSRSSYLRQVATTFNEAGDNGCPIMFNYTTREFSVNTLRNIRTSVSRYSTNVQDNTGKWIKWKGSSKARSRALSSSTPSSYEDNQIIPLYGLELEMRYDEEYADTYGIDSIYEQVLSIIGHDNCDVKYDSSIGSRGFELVTIPMPYHMMRKSIKDLTTNQLLTAEKLLTDSGCGVHFHISRDVLAPEVVAALIYIWNTPIWNDTLLETLTGGRAPTHSYAYKEGYNYPLFTKPHTFTEFVRDHFWNGKYDNQSRNPNGGDRGVVAFSNRHRTLELRGFNATLDPEELLSYIEFVDSTIAYMRIGNGGYKTGDTQSVVNPHHYIRWLLDSKSTGGTTNLVPRVEYNHLIRRIVLDILPDKFKINNNGTVDFQGYTTVATKQDTSTPTINVDEVPF